TLYSISKAYAIDIQDIIDENPGIENGITVNQVIKIPANKVNKKEIREKALELDGKFLLHTVKPGETLFSLARNYQLKFDDILDENTEAKEGLKVGMVLKIPTQKVNTINQTDVQIAKTDSFISHEVKPQETLYALSKLYQVNIDSIRIVNNGLPEGLKVGQT